MEIIIRKGSKDVLVTQATPMALAVLSHPERSPAHRGRAQTRIWHPILQILHINTLKNIAWDRINNFLNFFPGFFPGLFLRISSAF